MASPSIPKESVTVPISEEEFLKLQEGYFGINSLFFLLSQASSGEGLIGDLERVLDPFCSKISLVVGDLEDRFNKAGGES